MSGSRSLPSTPLGSRTPRHSGGSPAALSSPGGDLRLHQMIAVQGWMGVSLSFPYPYIHIRILSRHSGSTQLSPYSGQLFLYKTNRAPVYGCWHRRVKKLCI